MRSLQRSWRVWWLALALVAAPQLSFVHALSHIAAANAASQSDDERQQAPDKACETCLSLAHLGQALTNQHAWAAVPIGHDTPVLVATAQQAQRAPAHFHARAPPAFL